MTPVEWPIAAFAADGNAPARLARRGRLATVRRDFFLDSSKRLSEQERALMTAMLHCLVSDVAAALRAALGADLELAEASAQVLDHRDDERGIDALTASLVHFLEEAGSLTDELVLAAANEGEITFVAEVLARRARVPSDAVVDELLSGEAKPVMALLRAADGSRELAAGLLAGIGDLLGID